MSVDLIKMAAIIDNYLNCAQINDYCPNGVQIAGRATVRKIISGVTASMALIEAAIKENACALLVHHGYFWRGENPCLIGTKKQRIKALLENDISLLAYHLPLDLHLEVGNNMQLAKRFELHNCEFLANNSPVLLGDLNAPITGLDFADLVANILDKKPYLVDVKRRVQKVAICSGGGQNYFNQAIAAGADLFLTGEATEHNFHDALEYGVNFIAAGHHATERFGVQALGDYLAQKFKIEHKFIDIPNPF